MELTPFLFTLSSYIPSLLLNYFFCLCTEYKNFIDTKIIHIDNFKFVVFPFVYIRFFGNSAYSVCDKAAHGFIEVFSFTGEFFIYQEEIFKFFNRNQACLLYTSDAADE